ncbi:MAG: hypothetical protein QOH21_1749 [Acidobacteriota bacterium]|jgi:hypothetical protein|nr:hypothetical protein [Acidobacteriota bacterium]
MTGDERTAEIAIHPLPFTARVTMGSEPLPHAEVILRNASFQWHADLETDDAGRFAGELWQPGDYAAEYRGSTAADAAGHPPVAAEVVAVSNGVLRATAYVDQEGRVRIPVADTATVVFILGRDGSFAALRPTNDDVTAVTLAAPASSLRITTRTILGQPLPSVAMLIAYEGEVLPLEIASRFERAHGSLRTDSAGDLTLRNLPAGTYQFWPYASDSEAESILASAAPPPITVNVKPGENAVVVEFQAK